MKRILVGLLTIGVLCAATFVGGGCSPRKQAAKYRIVVIPKGTTHVFWQSIKAGAEAAAKEHGDVEIVWRGPSQEDKPQKQQDIIQNFVTESVSAIVLAPIDRRMLLHPVKEALRKDIPVVIIDSGLEPDPEVLNHGRYLGYVATDNEEGGRAAARRMVEVLDKNAKQRVLMIPYQAGSESTEMREKGFKEELAKHAPRIELIVANDEAGATIDTAQKASERVLGSLVTPVDAIFMPNESSAVGMLQALRTLKGKKTLLVGFDGSDVLINAIRSGELQGTVLQDPFNMGKSAVERAIRFLENGQRPKSLVQHTNLAVATKENVDDPKIRRMYNPLGN